MHWMHLGRATAFLKNLQFVETSSIPALLPLWCDKYIPAAIYLFNSQNCIFCYSYTQDHLLLDKWHILQGSTSVSDFVFVIDTYEDQNKLSPTSILFC